MLVVHGHYVHNYLMLSAAMMIGYFAITGVGDFIDCNVLTFMYYPTGMIFLTFLLMSIKGITFPFRHREFMKPRVACGILVAI